MPNIKKWTQQDAVNKFPKSAARHSAEKKLAKPGNRVIKNLSVKYDKSKSESRNSKNA